MIGASIAYDLVFLVHVVAAISTVVVFIAMRVAGLAVARGTDGAVQRARFPQRRNWGARILHLLPVTGLIMSLTGDSGVSLTRPWIGVGLLCYVLAAGHLEARTLPMESVISEVISHEGVASAQQGRSFVRSVDVLLGLVGVALIAMLVQF